MVALAKGPYVVKIDYTTTSGSQPITHTMELNCAALGAPAPGSPATTTMLATRSGGSVALSTAVQNWWSIVRLGLSTSGTALVGASLWRYDGPGAGDVFISTTTASPATGASAAGPNIGHQVTLTFRTGLGRIMKILVMESVYTLKSQSALVANSSGNFDQRMAAYALSSEGWMCGRGGSWPVAPLRLSQTFNEALEERRYRPNA